MMAGIEELSKQEFDTVREVLIKLIESLRDKRAHGLMIPDEEFILNSLLHPERGDVKVTVIRDHKMQIFLSNRRDETLPFSVMSNTEMREYTDRKFIDGVRSSLKEGHYGLFLISIQDQNNLAASRTKVEAYSSSYNISDVKKPETVDELKDLKTKKLNDCSLGEKWIIYKKSWDMDGRIPVIENELFGFKVIYARYKQKYNEESIILSPKKYKEKLGQMIRDIYPPNIRMSLKKDFPKDHAKNLEEVKKAVNSVLKSLDEKIETASEAEDYKNYLMELKLVIGNKILQDPDMSGNI